MVKGWSLAQSWCFPPTLSPWSLQGGPTVLWSHVLIPQAGRQPRQSTRFLLVSLLSLGHMTFANATCSCFKAWRKDNPILIQWYLMLKWPSSSSFYSCFDPQKLFWLRKYLIILHQGQFLSILRVLNVEVRHGLPPHREARGLTHPSSEHHIRIPRRPQPTHAEKRPKRAKQGSFTCQEAWPQKEPVFQPSIFSGANCWFQGGYMIYNWKECTILFREIPQNHNTFALFDPPKEWREKRSTIIDSEEHECKHTHKIKKRWLGTMKKISEFDLVSVCPFGCVLVIPAIPKHTDSDVSHVSHGTMEHCCVMCDPFLSTISKCMCTNSWEMVPYLYRCITISQQNFERGCINGFHLVD